MQRGKPVARNVENLFRGGVLHKTGGVMRVIEGARGRTLLVDRHQRPVHLDPKILARIPTTKREAFLRKRELLKKSSLRKNPEVAKVKDAIMALEIFRQEDLLISGARSFEAAGSAVQGKMEKQVQNYNLLKEAEGVAPQVRKASKVLVDVLAIPGGAELIKRLRYGKGVDPREFVKFFGVERDVATFQMRTGENAYFPLTINALRKLASERVAVIDAALEVLRAKREIFETQKVHAARELELLRKIGNARTLTPNQIAELYKFYEAQLRAGKA